MGTTQCYMTRLVWIVSNPLHLIPLWIAWIGWAHRMPVRWQSSNEPQCMRVFTPGCCNEVWCLFTCASFCVPPAHIIRWLLLFSNSIERNGASSWVWKLAGGGTNNFYAKQVSLTSGDSTRLGLYTFILKPSSSPNLNPLIYSHSLLYIQE